jgi:hypothetical protein
MGVGSWIRSLFLRAWCSLGAALHAAVAPTVRKLTGGYFFREGGNAIDEGIGIDSPGV